MSSSHDYNDVRNTLRWMEQDYSGLPVWPIVPTASERRTACSFAVRALDVEERVIALLHTEQALIKTLRDKGIEPPEVFVVAMDNLRTAIRGAK